MLSQPSERKHNNGYDNADYDLILCVNDVLESESGDASKKPVRQFRVVDMLGKGTFGQVVKAVHGATGEHVAVKVIKNKPPYFNQALSEIRVLKMVPFFFFLSSVQAEYPDHEIVQVRSSFPSNFLSFRLVADDWKSRAPTIRHNREGNDSHNVTQCSQADEHRQSSIGC